MCLALLSVWILYYLMGIPCLFLAVTGKRCPTCGSTRAMLSLLHGDFKLYASYQPMAIPLAIAVVLCIHLQWMRKPLRQVSSILAGAILFLNTALYLLK